MTGSPSRPLWKSPKRSRKDVLKTSTIREFGGGWNVIDNDLNLSTKFAKTLQNIFRAQDGSLQVRWGTRQLGATNNQSTTIGSLANNPIATVLGQFIVTVTIIAHELLSGHSITLGGLAAIGSLPASELNKLHNSITVVTADTFTVTITTDPAVTTSGGGNAGSFAHANKAPVGDLVNMEYFQDRIIAVTTSGQIVEVDSNGVMRIIWNLPIALKTGAAAGWSAMTFCSFAVFGGELIICNGIDKPLIVDLTLTAPTLPCQYLVDLAGSSNINTPIARYVLAMDHYLLMAGDPLLPGRVHVSNFDTSGTWKGDPAPNDATTVDIDKVITSQNATIRGIARFRDKVIVAVDDNLVLGTLGLVDSVGAHVPDFGDVVEQHGALAHRSMQTLGNDLLMADVVGVPSLSRSLLTNTLRPERASELVDPEIRKAVQALTIGASEDNIFSVYNQNEGQYMLFVPNNSVLANVTETQCFVYTLIPSLKIKAWSLFKGWNWRCATRSALKRIFFANKKEIFVYGTETDLILLDLVDAFSSTGRDAPIDFIWEFPWADFDQRMQSKKTKYISLDTRGKALFKVSMFVDNIPKNLDLTTAVTPDDLGRIPATFYETITSGIAWSNPSFSRSEDGAVASVSLAAGAQSDGLVHGPATATSAIPLKAFGISVSIKAFTDANLLNTAKLEVTLGKKNGANGFDVKSETKTITLVDLAPGVFYVVGAVFDDWKTLPFWDATFTPKDLSVRIVAKNTHATLTGVISIDAVKTDFYYPAKDAALTLPFFGSEFVGVDSVVSTSDERLWAWPSKFNISKFAVYGRATDTLQMISLSIGYHDGNIRR